MSRDIAISAPTGIAARLRQIAIPALFLMLGVYYASWSARLPAIRDALSLDAATLGTVLLGGGIGSVCSFPLAAGLVSKLGARRAALFTGMAFLLVLPVLPCIASWHVLMVGMLVLGALTSSFDVAINALGAQAERDAGRSIMSMLHAWFCVGTFVGALLGSAAAACQLPAAVHFLLISVALLVVLIPAYQSLPCDKPDNVVSKTQFALPHGQLIWVGMIAFLGAISEGSLSNWIPLYLRDHLHSSEGVAPLGYAAFAGAMLVARLAGDRLKERYGARRLVICSSFIAAVGIGLTVLSPGVGLAIPSLLLVGLGVAAVFPCVFSAAGREGPTSLAAVATLGYGGNLMGPPIMGFLVHGLGMQAGFSFLCLISLAVCITSAQSRLLR